MAAFFTFPLANLERQIESIALAIRTLSGDQLASELEELRGGEGISERLMARLYELELDRRVSPEHAFDAELDVALSRLEVATTAEDRARVSAIGMELHRLGGRAAQERALNRMIALASPSRRELRASILGKRWA